MNQALLEAVYRFVKRANEHGEVGRCLTEVEAADLVQSTRGRVPDWYASMMTQVPLAELSFTSGEMDEEGDRPHSLKWNDHVWLQGESLDAYPGLAILDRGYFCFASDMSGGGNPFFLLDGPDGNPAVYEVFHDAGTEADKIIAEACELMSPTLSAFLDAACFDG